MTESTEFRGEDHFGYTGGDRNIIYRGDLDGPFSVQKVPHVKAYTNIYVKIYDSTLKEEFARKILYLYQPDEPIRQVPSLVEIYEKNGHQNIVPVLRHGYIRDNLFIDMELCELDLRSYMDGARANLFDEKNPVFVAPKSPPQLELQNVFTIMGHVSDGLNFLHQQHYVHGDIKPRHILYSRKDNLWKIGFCSVFFPRSQRVITEAGSGTSGYRAPELLDYHEHANLTAKVDIWGLGCILYELVVGSPLFKDDYGVLLFCELKLDLEVPIKSYLPEAYNSHLPYLINETLHKTYEERPSASALLLLFRSYILVLEHTETGQDETQLILPTYAQWKQEVLAYNEEEGDFWSYLSRFITFETSKATVAVKSLVDAPSLSPGPTPDLLSISEDIEVMDGDYVEFYDEEAAVVSRVVLEFPRNVCMLIDQYQTKLAELVSPFDAEYHVEAGYDIIPNGCSLASPEQYASFQGCREMLWVTRKPANFSDAADRGTEYSLKESFILIKVIAETIYSPVGLLDIASQVVLAYDVNTMTFDPDEFMSSILVNDTPEDAAPVETRRSAVSVRTSGSRRSRQHAANPSSNYHPPATYPRPSESIPRNNAVSNAPRGFDVHSVPTAVTNPAPTSATSLGKQTATNSPNPEPNPPPAQQSFPFSCSAKMYGLDRASQVLSTSLWLKIESIGHEVLANQMMIRSHYKVTAERGIAQLTKDEAKAPLMGLEDVRLKMGPCIDGFEGTEREMDLYQQSFRAHWKYPELHHIVVKDGTSSSQVGGNVSLAFFPPSGSAGVSWTKAKGISLPGKSLGFDLKQVSVECLTDQRYLWRYPISSSKFWNLPQSLFARSTSFDNHWGEFSYASDQPPSVFRIEIPVIYRLSSLGIVQSSFTFIQYKDKKFPCRDIRMNLQVDILPDEHGCFDFPRVGYSGGKDLHLGIYTFTDEDENLCLQIDQRATQLKLDEEDMNQDYHGLIHGVGNWGISGAGPGKFKVQDNSSENVVSPAEGTLEFEVKRSGR